MRRKAVDHLLEALDQAVNSNSYWITLSTNEDKKQLANDLVQHLRTGSFHYELVKEDLNRGFYDYSEMVFVKGFETPTFLQKPGNVWKSITLLYRYLYLLFKYRYKYPMLLS